MSRAQLLAAGVSARAIEHRLATGRLHRLHHGVYAVGHPIVGREGRWLAAVLAVGPDALLSHRSAGALWDLRASTANQIDVSSAARARRQRPGIRVHRPHRLDPNDVTEERGIPCTGVARTIADLAAVVERRTLSGVLRRAEELQLLDAGALHQHLSPGRRGAARLRSALATHREAIVLRSELEARFLDLCEAAQLPLPHPNRIVAGHEVDFLWPDHHLAAETDGYATHRTRHAFERDRRRDAALLTAGIRTVRFTWRQVTNEPNDVARTLNALLRL